MARPIVPQSVASRDVDLDLDPDGPVPVGMKRTRAGKLKRRNILWRIRRILVGGVAIALLASSAAGAQFWSSVTVPKELNLRQTTYLCDAYIPTGCTRDNAFASLRQAESGQPVRYAQIPEVMRYALVASEDKDFFTHKGVDLSGIARAVLTDVRTDAKQGGSTLTQQLIKVMSSDVYNSFGARTYAGKVKEAVQAMKLEQEIPKQEILTRYLNAVYFGRNARGIDAAVRAYFGRDAKVENIDLKQAAYLAAVIREPEQVDANLGPKKSNFEDQRRYATTRRRQVLDAMLGEGYINEAERDAAADAGWDYVVVKGQGDNGDVLRHPEIGGAQWRDYVKAWIRKNTPLTEEDLTTKGLRIYTSMDPMLQAFAHGAVGETLRNTPMPYVGPKEQKPVDQIFGPEASLTSLDDQGYVRAMVGSRDYKSSLNIAVSGLNLGLDPGAGRQPGSAIKPVVLAQALMTPGFSLDKKYPNPRKRLVGPEGGHKEEFVTVEGEETSYDIDLVDAISRSSNTVFGQLMFDISNRDTIELAKKLGLTDANFEKDAPNTAFLGIGGPVHVTTLDMATIYSTFANHGAKVGPYPVVKITDSSGKIVWPQAPPARDQVIPPDIADQVSFALSHVLTDPMGTGKDAKVPELPEQTLAGKTGTVALQAGGNSNAWFVGYTCKLTAAVWMGHRDDVNDMGTIEGVKEVNGGTLPAAIFRRYMTEATKGRETCPFVRPQSSMPSTTLPIAGHQRERPATTEDDDDRPGRDHERDERTTTTRRSPFPTRPIPSTTDPDDRPTTTRRNQATTTEPDEEDPPRPGRPGLLSGEP
jgi:membrane peptidoglycan carboxypeptidase